MSNQNRKKIRTDSGEPKTSQTTPKNRTILSKESFLSVIADLLPHGKEHDELYDDLCYTIEKLYSGKEPREANK